MSEPYISDIISLLDRYIEKKEIGEEIYPVLKDLLHDVEKLSEEAYEQLDRTFLKVTIQEDMSNFLFFHSIRNLRLTTLKIIDQFKLAKEQKLNPLIAKNLKQFINPYVKFLFFLRVIQDETFPKIDLISNELEKFRESAKQYSFLCSTDEELEYDKITHKEFRELINSLKSLRIEAMH
jgi:hypothetical protein